MLLVLGSFMDILLIACTMHAPLQTQIKLCFNYNLAAEKIFNLYTSLPIVKLRLQLQLHTGWKFIYNNLQRRATLFVTAAERLPKSVHVCDTVTTQEALDI
jgi:uncharacterized membrane protein YciS (DUF1049 family)